MESEYIYDDFEPEIDFDKPWQEHFKTKTRKSKRRFDKRNKTKHLCNQLGYGGWKPSIWRRSIWDDKTQKYVDIERIKRAKHSNMQAWMKKYSNSVIRHIDKEAIPVKGHRYRKYFDYWWIWI